MKISLRGFRKLNDDDTYSRKGNEEAKNYFKLLKNAKKSCTQIVKGLQNRQELSYYFNLKSLISGTINQSQCYCYCEKRCYLR